MARIRVETPILNNDVKAAREAARLEAVGQVPLHIVEEHQEMRGVLKVNDPKHDVQQSVPVVGSGHSVLVTIWDWQ